MVEGQSESAVIIVLMVGLPASGKSSLVRAMTSLLDNSLVICADKIQNELSRDRNCSAATVYHDAKSCAYERFLKAIEEN